MYKNTPSFERYFTVVVRQKTQRGQETLEDFKIILVISLRPHPALLVQLNPIPIGILQKDLTNAIRSGFRASEG